jgi:hypothetical protein
MLYHLSMQFVQPHQELTDDEVLGILREAIASAGGLTRQADLLLASVGAEHLVDSLRAVGLHVIRPVQWRLHR